MKLAICSKYLTYVCLGIASFGYAVNGSGPSIQLSQFVETDFNSQSSQDQFVYTLLYELLDKQDSGYYLEIGAGEPISINNSKTTNELAEDLTTYCLSRYA